MLSPADGNGDDCHAINFHKANIPKTKKDLLVPRCLFRIDG